MSDREHAVWLNGHRIYARVYDGGDPSIVLCHGFPDNMHLYDRLVPHLAPSARVVTFDFLGWGASDKPSGDPRTADKQTGELDVVIGRLAPGPVILVAHDASGPPVIDWALAHPDRVAGLVLLNTYYQWTPALRRPEAIALYSTPVVRTIAREVIRRSDKLDRALYFWQVGGFIRDEARRSEMVPLLYEQFRDARPAFWALNDDLISTVWARRKMIPKMRAFARPVRIIFGDADPYLNRDVAKKFHALFPSSDLFLLPGARHYVQVDEPEEVARLILSAPFGFTPSASSRDRA